MCSHSLPNCLIKAKTELQSPWKKHSPVHILHTHWAAYCVQAFTPGHLIICIQTVFLFLFISLSSGLTDFQRE